MFFIFESSFEKKNLVNFQKWGDILKFALSLLQLEPYSELRLKLEHLIEVTSGFYRFEWWNEPIITLECLPRFYSLWISASIICLMARSLLSSLVFSRFYRSLFSYSPILSVKFVSLSFSKLRMETFFSSSIVGSQLESVKPWFYTNPLWLLLVGFFADSVGSLFTYLMIFLVDFGFRFFIRTSGISCKALIIFWAFILRSFSS